MEALSFYIAQIVGLNKDCLQREHSMTYNKKFSKVQKSLSASSAQCHLLVLSSEPSKRGYDSKVSHICLVR